MTRESFLPFARPSIGDAEIDEVVATLRSGWLTTGPRVANLENEFRDLVGAPAALALSSGTAALHLALLACGVGPGDAVITTPMTFSSTAHVIEHVGARPVLCDVLPDTLNLDPERVAAGLNEARDVRAVLPVHYGGQACDMDALLALARDHDLAVIEDAAHALPTTYRGRLIGAVEDGLRHAVCFSFYATKTVTTGEGGMLTATPELIEDARIWSLHGMSRDAWRRYREGGTWAYDVVRAGFKYNLSDLHAAVGVHQLRRVHELDDRRRQIAQAYTAAFGALDALETPTELPSGTSSWHLYPLRLHLDQLDLSRARFIDELTARNIGTSVHFIPLHLLSYYRDRYGWKPEDVPVATREFERLVSLPIYPSMTDDDVGDVIEAVQDVVATARR